MSAVLYFNEETAFLMMSPSLHLLKENPCETKTNPKIAF